MLTFSWRILFHCAANLLINFHTLHSKMPLLYLPKKKGAVKGYYEEDQKIITYKLLIINFMCN